jgi:hypothetical protein
MFYLMKKFFFVAAVAACVVGLSSCGGDDDTKATTYSCTCEGRTPAQVAATGLTDTQKASYEAACVKGDNSAPYTKGVAGTANCKAE